MVLAGKDKGKRGTVLEVRPKKGRALVEGVAMAKKHLRKSQENPKGAIVHQENSVHLSNLALLCPVTNKATRYQTSVAGDGSKQRLSAKNKAVLA